MPCLAWAFEAALIVLICDETGKPNWYPVGLFDFDGHDQPVPEDWEFALLDARAASGTEEGGWAAIWGYRDLVRDRDHVERLIERDPEALRTFFEELHRRVG